jgi:hypothetical protein
LVKEFKKNVNTYENNILSISSIYNVKKNKLLSGEKQLKVMDLN